MGRVGYEDHISCVAVGFPNAEKRSDGTRDTKEIRGHIESLTGAKSSLLSVYVDKSAVPSKPVTRNPDQSTMRSAESPSGDESQWSGASGAALFAESGTEKLLIGVVTTDRLSAYPANQLSAVPLSALVDQPGFISALESVGIESELKPVGAESDPKRGTSGRWRGPLAVLATIAILLVWLTIHNGQETPEARNPNKEQENPRKIQEMPTRTLNVWASDVDEFCRDVQPEISALASRAEDLPPENQAPEFRSLEEIYSALIVDVGRLEPPSDPFDSQRANEWLEAYLNRRDELRDLIQLFEDYSNSIPFIRDFQNWGEVESEGQEFQAASDEVNTKGEILGISCT